MTPEQLEARLNAVRRPKTYPVPTTGEIGPIEKGWVGKGQEHAGAFLSEAGEKLDLYNAMLSSALRTATGTRDAPRTTMGPGEMSGLQGAGSGLTDSSNKMPLVRMEHGLGSLKVDPRAVDVATFALPAGVHVAKGVAGGLKQAGREFIEDAARAGMSPLDVFHGTPHTFAPTERNPLGEFSDAHVGTGEGNQTFGHGAAYLAENPRTGRHYQRLGRGEGRARDVDLGIDEQALIQELDQMVGPGDERTLEWIKNDIANEGGVDEAIEVTRKAVAKVEAEMKTNPEWFMEHDIVDLRRQLAALERVKGTTKLGPPKGTLYTADLKDEVIPHMLDLDRPMSEQEVFEKVRNSGVIRDAIVALKQRAARGGTSAAMSQHHEDILRGGATGKLFYDTLAHALGGKEQASAALQKVGVTGNKYLDNISRGVGEGTRNFVVFDPQHAPIIKRETGGITETVEELRARLAAESAALRKE